MRCIFADDLDGRAGGKNGEKFRDTIEKPKPGLASACLGKAALRSLALSLAAELAPEGIHAATVTVCGFVQPGSPLAPEHVAEAFWELHGQEKTAWESERTMH